jgi:hypothetical protein
VRLLAGVLVLALAARLFAEQPAHEEGSVSFCAMDIYVDSHSAPLAAYQIDFAITNGVAKVAGIEGGEHPAFREPPFYDPKAMQRERVIIAAFSTEPARNLPTGKTRVATVHVQVAGDDTPGIALKLQAAADANGRPLSATATVQERKLK